jgi:hypothetical protein
MGPSWPCLQFRLEAPRQVHRLPSRRSKTYQEAFGFASTDDTGYFLINVVGAQTGTKTTPPLFLTMTNTKGEPIFLSTAPFQPAPGSVTYQNITLPSVAHPFGDPPEAVRDVALPSRKSKPSTKGKK